MTPIPSQPGDVLILFSRRHGTLHVGRVWRRGQWDLLDDVDVRAFTQTEATLARLEADRLLMTPDHDVYFVEIDEDRWSCLTRH